MPNSFRLITASYPMHNQGGAGAVSLRFCLGKTMAAIQGAGIPQIRRGRAHGLLHSARSGRCRSPVLWRFYYVKTTAAIQGADNPQMWVGRGDAQEERGAVFGWSVSGRACRYHGARFSCCATALMYRNVARTRFGGSGAVSFSSSVAGVLSISQYIVWRLHASIDWLRSFFVGDLLGSGCGYVS